MRKKEEEARDERDRERKRFFLMKGRRRMKQNGMDLMNGWWLCMNVCIGVFKSWQVTRQVKCKKR